MRVGVPRESAAGERRVALVPEVVSRLADGGFEVLVERGAGDSASFPDDSYTEAGARIVGDPWEAEAVVKVQKPSADEAGRLRQGQVLIGFLQPLTDKEGLERLAGARGDALPLGEGPPGPPPPPLGGPPAPGAGSPPQQRPRPPPPRAPRFPPP